MRLFGIAILSVLFSSLAIVGGGSGALLCLHQTGVFHMTPASKPEHPAPATASAWDAGNKACDRGSEHSCDWCLDFEVQGFDLGQLPFENTHEEPVAGAAANVTFSSREWKLPTSFPFSSAFSRAPPAQPQALIVVRKIVLLL